MEEKDKGIKTKMPSSPPNRHSKEKGRLEEGEKGEGWRERDRVSMALEDISERRSQGGHILQFAVLWGEKQPFNCYKESPELRNR